MTIFLFIFVALCCSLLFGLLLGRFIEAGKGTGKEDYDELPVTFENHHHQEIKNDHHQNEPSYPPWWP